MSGISYPKEFVKPDGRKLVSGGPRDLQRRQAGQPLPELDLNNLKKEFHTLREELIKARLQKVPKGFFSPEQVDEEIRKAVEQAVAETMLLSKKTNQNNNQNVEQSVQKYKIQIFELQKSKDALIKTNKTEVSNNTVLKEQVKKLEVDLNEANELKKDIAVLKQNLIGKEELIETLKSKVGSFVEEMVDTNRPKMEQRFIDPLEKDAGEGLESHIDITDVTASEKDNMSEKVDKLKNLLGKLPNKN